MKKRLAAILVMLFSLAMAFVLTGCGDKHGDVDGSGTKVGCIYSGVVGDGGTTQVMDEGLVAAAEETGVELIKKESVSEHAPGNKKEVKDTVRNLIDQGCKIIVGCSAGYEEALKELADSGKYDDVAFLNYAGKYHNSTNMENFFGSMEEARYLTGMAAAAVSKKQKLGYVADKRNTEVQIGINAFTLGAQAVDSDVKVKVIYINSSGDPEIEKNAAKKLIRSGCDVLSYHADSIATQLAAKDAGIYATGWKQANNEVGEKYISSAYWDMKKYFIPAIQSVLDGTFKPSDNKPFSSYGSIESGLIKVDEFGKKVPKVTVDEIEKIKEQMKNEEFKVFSGAIRYNNGKVLCKKGQTLSTEQIWKTNGEVKGVEVISGK